MTDEDLYRIARESAERIRSLDRKQLRFNEIVETAKEFYPTAVDAGVRELVASCNREDGSPELIGPCLPHPLYVRGAPMWKTLRENYSWMLAS